MAWTPGNTDSAMAAGGGIIGSVISGLFGNRQARLNREAQQAENQKERDFNAEQAELSRQWQEKMYNLHESPQAQAQAMRQAGIGLTDGIQNMSVGSASTASGGGSALPAAPSPWTGVGDAIGAGLSQLPFIKEQIKAAKLDNDQRALTAEKTRAETFKTWQEGYQTQIENGFTAEEKQAIIDNLKQDFKNKDNDNKLTEMQIQFIQDAKDAGVNPVIDESNESRARTRLANAQSATEDILRLPRKAQIEMETAFQALKYELEDKYGRLLSQATANKVALEVREFVRSAKLRENLLKAQVDQAKADAIISKLESWANSIDYNYLKELAGNGNDWYSPLGILIYALFNKDGIANIK